MHDGSEAAPSTSSEPRASARTSPRKKANVVASSVIVGVVIVYGATHRHVAELALREAYSRFSLATLACALGLTALQNLCQASRLWILLPGNARLPWGAVVRVYAWGQLVNNYVPARAGDVLKVALLRKASQAADKGQGETGAAATMAGSVLGADKLVDIASLVLVVALMAPGWLAEVRVPTSLTGVTWTLIALGVGGLLGVILLLRQRPFARVRTVASDALRGLAGLAEPPRLGLALGFGMAAWLSEAAAIRLLASAAQADLTLGQSLWVLVVLNLGIAVPISFANIGTFEASIAFGLSRFAVPVPIAFAIATAHHIVQATCVLLLASMMGALAAVRRTNELRVRIADKTRALAHYERVSGHYDSHVARGLLKLLRDRERRLVLGVVRFDHATGKTMLDVGCGGGSYALEAKRAGLHVSAVDASPGMVEKIRSRVDEAWVGDIETLKSERTYDLVACIGVLDFVLDPEVAFENLTALVAPGGRLVIHAPRTGIGGLLYRFEKRFIRVEVNLFSHAWFEAQAERRGFRVTESVDPLPFNRVMAFERKSDVPVI